MIYSIVPHEVIMGVDPYERSPRKEIEYMGYKLEVQDTTSTSYRINRILSTDLKAFLNPSLQPGNIIEKTLK